MKFIRVSPLTGVQHEKEIDVTQEELTAWQRGKLIQHAMPRASAGEREFIKTGYTEEDWEQMWKEEDPT